MKSNIKELWQSVGGLSVPSKMPCHAYSLPARLCTTGSKLRHVANSTCASCYALKGNYRFPNVQKSLDARYASVQSSDWTDKMVTLIQSVERSGFFRWHDSGDLIDLEHLRKICIIADRLPQINFWLPTREYGVITSYRATYGKFPENLTIRLSAYMIDRPAPVAVASIAGVHTSTVSSESGDCPAPRQGNVCGECRRCWDKSVANVSYSKH